MARRVLAGPPGAGKTFCAQALAERLKAQVFGPLSVGEDTTPDDIVGVLKVEAGNTLWHAGTIDAWARASGEQVQLLVVDEANLAPEHFWNFLNGLFDAAPSLILDGERVPLGPHHRVLFTGNEDSFAGRTTPQPIKSHFVTVPFQAFDDSFLLNECLLPTLTRLAPQLTTEMRTQLQHTCQQVLDGLRAAEALPFVSPRNIEEATLRTVMRLYEADTPNLPAAMAHSMLDAVGHGQTVAASIGLRAWATLHFGATTPLSDPAWCAPEAHSRRRLVETETSLHLAEAVGEFLAVRQRRRQGHVAHVGQTGMLIEGPSGRGKDEWVMSMCEAAGLPQLPTDRMRTGDGYMVLNAGLGFAQLKESIGWAQRQGQLVLISELNLLGSALVEGQLNALLQGDAAFGFAVVATVNPGYQGRRAMSEAQRNRCVCVRLQPYRESELMQIVSARLGEATASLASTLVAYHQGVISLLNTAKRTTEPTPRDLLRVCDGLPTVDVQALLQEVYEPYLIMANSAQVDAALRLREPLTHLQRLATDVQEVGGHILVQRVQADPNGNGFGSLHPPTRSLSVSAQGSLAAQTAQTLVQGLGAAAHPNAVGVLAGAEGAAWASLATAIGLRLLSRVCARDDAALTSLICHLPALPDGQEAWTQACEADTRQAHFALGLACELMYPDTHASMPQDKLTTTQRAACAEVIEASAKLRATIEQVPAMGNGDIAAALEPVRVALQEILERYIELAPLTAWQAIGKFVPTETMAAIWHAGAEGLSVAGHVMGRGLSVVGHGAKASAHFVARHKKPVLIATSPIWIGPAAGALALAGGLALGVAVGVGAIAAGTFAVAGVGAGLEWGARKVVPHWRLNRNLPSPNKAFAYHGSLDLIRTLDFAERPQDYIVARKDGAPTYLAEGYCPKFTSLGNVKTERTAQLRPPSIALGQDNLPIVETTVSITLDAQADVRKSAGQYRVSLPTEGELCPSNVRVYAGVINKLLPGHATVIRVEDGRFVAVLDHSHRTLFGPRSTILHSMHQRLMSAEASERATTEAKNYNDSQDPLVLKYDLVRQTPAPFPEGYGMQPLPFAIDYGRWPEFAEFCDVLSPAAPARSAAALCQWLQENALYDRGVDVALAYGLSEVDCVFHNNPVNTFLKLRRGTSLQAAQVFMAVVRDKLRVPVRLATGTYHGTPRTARQTMQTMHAWCEVFLEGQGFTTFDPMPRRHKEAWVKARFGFFDKLAEATGMYHAPRHVLAVEKLGDTLEHPTPLRETLPSTRLRVSYEVEGDAEIAARFVEYLGRNHADALFFTGLRPQMRLSSAPPGVLDVARLARGEIKTFINTDVGRAPLRKTVVVAACDIHLRALEGRNESPVRPSRVFWQAFFDLGCPLEVVCHDGRIVRVGDVDEILTLAYHADMSGDERDREVALRQDDAVAAWALTRRQQSLQHGQLHLRPLQRVFMQMWAEESRPVQEPPKVAATITSFDVTKSGGWGALTDVTFKNIWLPHRIYAALQHMPNLRSITIAARMGGQVRIPYLPYLQAVYIQGTDEVHMLRVHFDFVPGGTPWQPRLIHRGPFGWNLPSSSLGSDVALCPPLPTERLIPMAVGDAIKVKGVAPAPQQVLVPAGLQQEQVPAAPERDLSHSGSNIFMRRQPAGDEKAASPRTLYPTTATTPPVAADGRTPADLADELPHKRGARMPLRVRGRLPPTKVGGPPPRLA